MSNSPISVQGQQKPGWILPVLLVGAVSAVLNFGGVWSWWALLWAPLSAIAVGAMGYEWRLLSQCRWRMSALEWALLAVSHVGLAASLAAVLGVLRS
ncbi:hypothetical protein ACIPW5_26820 [Streptomyces sp. NPDC090077]|uniref:hypothetical protein n=1 Tax=Streptomyces sp. NPDC090077 TaxID=3365938 RepID=UPI00381FA65E